MNKTENRTNLFLLTKKGKKLEKTPRREIIDKVLKVSLYEQ